MTQPGPEHSVGELVTTMTEQVSVLIRDELKLAQLEMANKGKQAALGAGMFGVSGVVALYGVACLLACAIIAISGVVPAWLAALIVGVALAGRRRGDGAAGPGTHEQGNAPGARAGRGRCQGRRRGNQGKGTPMTAPEIQQEIEQTRERLGQTVEELAAKADVKARAQARANEMKAKAQVKAAEVKTKAQAKATEVSGQLRQNPAVQRRWPVAAAAAGAVILGSVLVWRRRKT